MICRSFLVVILATRVFLAQEISRQSATPSTPPADPTDLLTRARDKIATVTRRLRKYRCLDTIDRTYYVVPIEKTSVT